MTRQEMVIKCRNGCGEIFELMIDHMAHYPRCVTAFDRHGVLADDPEQDEQDDANQD